MLPGSSKWDNSQSFIYLAWSVRLAKAGFQVRHEIKIKNGKVKTTLEVYKIKYSDNYSHKIKKNVKIV